MNKIKSQDKPKEVALLGESKGTRNSHPDKFVLKEKLDFLNWLEDEYPDFMDEQRRTWQGETK